MNARILGALVAALAVVSLSAQQGPDRSKAPVPGPAPILKLPPIQKRALTNGLPVWIVEMHEVPVASLALIIKAGAAADPIGKYGVANFTAAMLDDGAGSRNALELADAIEFLGASIGTNSTFDASSVRLQTPVSKLDDALPLMADIALRPTFAPAEVERLRKERLTSLLQTRDNASGLASAGFARLVFGAKHRYGTMAMGNDASNGEMSAADLRSFYTAFYQPQNAHLIVVGDVTPDGVMPKGGPETVLKVLQSFDPAAIPDPKGKQVVFACRSGKRSVTASLAAQAAGLPYDKHLAGGILGWKAAGLQTKTGG